ncbi:MAG: hypothetical protein ACKONH_00665, partial [Planctomycetia bacterium]
MNGSDAARAAAIEHNARAWDRLVDAGAALARPALDDAFADPRGWLGRGGTGRPWLPERLDGLEVLCLAAGVGEGVIERRPGQRRPGVHQSVPG